MRQTFVRVLRTPALLATFAKDPVAAAQAHVSLRFLASLEPAMIMPEILARAYSGLEVVNETHRTTAVLSLLNTVAHPLVSEKIWLGGQKHVLELLELSVPGLDLVEFLCSIHLQHS
jgi:proteasome activator subunit 4